MRLTNSQVGAGIQIPPNSGSLLRRWGVLQRLESKAVKPDSINFRRWANGATIGYTDLRQFEANFRAPYYVCHRAHLHESLHARAIELGVEVRLESKVARYHGADSRVELVDGSDISGDLVVAADGKYSSRTRVDRTVADVYTGIRSGARTTILGDLEPLAPSTGFAAYRATVDVEKMKAHPELCWILEKPALNIW
jgi:salicylate hydroxylase